MAKFTPTNKTTKTKTGTPMRVDVISTPAKPEKPVRGKKGK